MILENIKNINDIKKLSYDELNSLANEVREYIVDVISKNGGHLASSLGVVELTIALIYVLDLPNDKIIWDVGHQSYAYKILTDRKEEFKNIRKYKGISGFPKRKESQYDFFDTGHSSTSISAGLGYVVSRDLKNDKNFIVSVIGDGALTGGEAFEALQNLSKIKSNFIIILNDNEMSIAPSNGGMTHALSGVRTSRRYNFLKEIIKKFLLKFKNGENIKKHLSSFMNAIKHLFVNENGMFFENLDIVYLGPINGHNIKDLINILNESKKMNRPVAIHIKTKKGKGYLPAEKNPVAFHGVSQFDIKTGDIFKDKTKITYTDVFSDEICKLAEDNEKIVCITAAMPDGTGLTKFQSKFKNRFFDVGICEEHAITFAAGMSLSGLIPVIPIYSSFLQRGYDQIIEDICMQNLHSVFMIDRAGLVGRDGETHHGLFDISFLKSIPNITIMAPKDDDELKNMIQFAINECNGPVAIRYPRGEVYHSTFHLKNKIEYGKSEILSSGEKLVILAYGSMVEVGEKIINEKKCNATLVNLRFAKPIDTLLIDNLILKNDNFLILEEGIMDGGIGESIKSYICNKYSDNYIDKMPKIFNIAINDKFIEHGSPIELKIASGLDYESIINKYFEGGKCV